MAKMAEFVGFYGVICCGVFFFFFFFFLSFLSHVLLILCFFLILFLYIRICYGVEDFGGVNGS